MRGVRARAREGAVADRTVYFAKIRREARLFDRSFEEDILEALDPHLVVTRYRRSWRFSRPQRVDGFIAAKLGFVRITPAAETTYDEELEDFVTTEGIATQGSFSMFVIDAAQEIIAFEERRPDIRLQSFLGNFKALLAVADFRATVELLRDQSGFHEWAASLDRLVRVRAVVHAPNPGWNEDAGAFRTFVEDANAERAEVVAIAPDDGVLNAEARWISGALDQIAEQGQGKVTAVGYDGQEQRRWESGTRLRTTQIRDEDADTAEDVWGWLMRKVREFYGS
jgi:hypothetical protein